MAETGTTQSKWSMWSGGSYSLHTQGAKDGIDGATAMALEALGQVDVEADSGAFNLVDYGAADGGTSLELLGKLVAGVRARSSNRPICVTYTDLPRNDFSNLFATVHGQIPGVSSYLDEVDGVHVFASATSFYQPIFPAASIDLGFSATAMHWISAVPGPISNHVHAAGAKGAELEAFRARALADWQAILVQRAAELKPGGRLILCNLCQDDQGRNLGNHREACMLDTFNELWRALRDRGTITADEYHRTAFPQFYKTLEEFCAPLQDESSPVYQAGLRLEAAKTHIVECPYRRLFQQEGNVAAFAEALVPTTRSWSETIFLNSLDSQRSEAERHAIVDSMYSAYVDRVKADPTGHAMDYVYCYQVIKKT